MNPDQHFQSSLPPPPPTSSFSFPYDHHHHHHHLNRYSNNGDNHHRASPRKIHHYNHHHPHAKTDVANNKEGEEEETHSNDHMMSPSSTTYVITMPSCPSSSSTSTSAYSSPSSSSSANMPTGSKSYELQQSKEAAQTLPSTSPSDMDEFYAKNICSASALVVSYLIEVTIQILLAIQCYRSFQYQQQLELVTDTTVEQITSSSSSSSSPWSWFLVISSVLSSFLVTLISIMWVFRGMDFSGRLCGRLLCYVMHFFLLGLLWRYLKLAFAYDRADLEEFFKLKTIQTYVQSLPLVTIHLAWVLLTTQQQLLPFTSSPPHAAAAAVDSYHALSSWLVVVEMLSAVISFLILSSSTVSSLTYNNNNLQVVVDASPSSSTTCSSPGDNRNKARRSKNCTGGGANSHKLKVERSSEGGNNPNHHFNDSGTALSVDNHGAAEQEDNDDENDIEGKGKSACSSSSLKTLMTIAIKWMMSHYSQKCEPGRALLLVSRVISLGMLVYKMNYYWTGFITLLHFGVSIVWLGCWTSGDGVDSSSKSNCNIKTAMSTTTSRSSRRGHDSNDTCCDTRSNGSSSNDSGLVVKSEVLMENGIPCAAVSVAGDDDGDIQASTSGGGDVIVDIDGDDGEGHNNVDFSVNSYTRGGDGRSNNDFKIKNTAIIKEGDHHHHHHVNPLNSLSGGLSSCLSVVVHRRNRNAGNDKKLSQKRNNQRQQVLMRVLPLAYVLFWDLSNSPCAYQLSGSNPTTTGKRLSLWATAFPVFVTLVENVFITIYHHVWTSSGEPNMRFLTVFNAACLALGWLLVAAYQFKWRGISQQQQHQQRDQRKLKKNQQVDEEDSSAAPAIENERDEDDVDSGYGKNKGNSCIAGAGGDSGVSSDASVKSMNKKETGECLTLCCSSLSHPLNIKRKGRRDQQEQEANNFCKDSSNDKLSPVDRHHHHHQPRDVTIVKYNEYQEQQELGKLMSAQRRQQPAYNLNSHNNNNNKLNDDGSGQSSRNNSTIIKSSIIRGVAKKSTIFPDLGISTDHTGVNVGEEGQNQHHYHHHQDNYNKICSSSKPESMMRCRDDVKLTNKACGTTATITAAVSLPVTNNNYTNIKEALTRRISNKSCTNGSLKKSHHHQQHQLQNNNRTSQDRESVKGDGEEEEEGEPRVAISSFKSSSSPSTRVHQQQHQATPTNSNKCMPISIKSPISWLPETCCNDSNGSGSGGSSNSRNTNTLVMPEPTVVAAATTTNGSRLFYCPEKYIDLGNNTSANIAAAAVEETEESNRTSRKLQQQPKQQRQQPHHHNHKDQNPDNNEGSCDFSVVFFEGRPGGGGTSRSYKQKQSRTPVASNALLLRAARSANSTPVACSKPFPLDIGAITGVVQQQQQNHPRFQPHQHSHHHQYSSYNEHDDDEVDPIERATKEEGASHRRIRNQITGKTYLSDGASLTSLDGLCEIRASTPVEIKKASRVIVNYPPPHHQISDSKTVSRCLCKVDTTSPSPERARKNNNRKRCGLSPLFFNDYEDDHAFPTRASGNSNSNNNNNIYEKLIDDSYGILICEGEKAPGKNSLNRKSCNNKSSRSNTCTDSNSDPHHYQHQIVRLSEASELRRTAGGGGGGSSQKLKILCAKCLENHDPLLTNCVDPLKMGHDDHLPEIVDCHFTSAANNNIDNLAMMQNWQDQHHKVVSHSPYPIVPPGSDTTDYPSDTEFTTNNNPVEDDGQSLSTHFSSATYTWHHHHPQQHHNYQQPHHHKTQQQPKPTQLSQFIWAASTMNKPSLGGCDDDGGGAAGSSNQQQECPKEFTGLEYVRTWLMASHPRTFAINNNISHINNTNNNSSSGCNDTHQHPLEHDQSRPQHQQENGIKKKSVKNSNGSLRRYAAYQHHLQQGSRNNDKGLTLLSSSTASKNTNNNVIIPFKHKSACDKPISKKKRFRQLEKRQRPIGRGASPPAKELASASSNNFNGNVDVLNSISATVATALPTLTASNIATTAAHTRDDCGGGGADASPSTRFQPPPSRKQHPLLFYDMKPRQEQQKPLTATSHKKCRDQLDLFHKELETVV